MQTAHVKRPYEAPADELMTLENASLRVQVWPRMGGKIVSIRARSWNGEQELLHAPIHAYSSATATSGFELSDAGGWDECLPTVAACSFQGAELADHGDVWRQPWQAVRKNDSLLAHVNAAGMPLRFSRWLSLDGPTMHLRYSVTNIGNQGADFLWSAHPLLQVEEGDRILLPDTVQKVRVEGSSESRLLLTDGCCQWPHAMFVRGGYVDLSTVGARDGATSHKLFAGPLTHGWCGLYRSQLKMGIMMRFDPGQTPFAGMWISQGAWPPGGSGEKQYTVAIEPTTAPCDALDRAANEGHAQHLLPQAELSWPVQFEVYGSHQALTYDEFHALASTAPRH